MTAGRIPRSRCGHNQRNAVAVTTSISATPTATPVGDSAAVAKAAANARCASRKAPSPARNQRLWRDSRHRSPTTLRHSASSMRRPIGLPAAPNDQAVATKAKLAPVLVSAVPRTEPWRMARTRAAVSARQVRVKAAGSMRIFSHRAGDKVRKFDVVIERAMMPGAASCPTLVDRPPRSHRSGDVVRIRRRIPRPSIFMPLGALQWNSGNSTPPISPV